MWSLPDNAKAKGENWTTEHMHSRHRHYTLSMFTLLLAIRTQRYMWSLDKVGCTAKSSQQSFCHWWQNIHYHLINLQNHIITNILDVVRIITTKHQIFSVRSSPDPPIFKKIAVWSSPDPAKIGFSPDPCSFPPCVWNIARTSLSLWMLTRCIWMVEPNSPMLASRHKGISSNNFLRNVTFDVISTTEWLHSKLQTTGGEKDFWTP